MNGMKSSDDPYTYVWDGETRTVEMEVNDGQNQPKVDLFTFIFYFTLYSMVPKKTKYLFYFILYSKVPKNQVPWTKNKFLMRLFF
jgi:hypothetical protein